MNDLDFSNVAVLLFDPVGPNMSSTRAVLKGLGFSRIEAVKDFAEFARHLSDGAYELILAEVADVEGDVEGLVRRLRGGDIGLNPFAVVILTSWARKRSEVSAAIDCGSDDVLLRPFSPARLQERIETFVRKRKPFVVTGDYIGPDRRKEPKRQGNIDLLTPPNGLQAAATGDYEALRRQGQEIQAAFSTLSNQRIRRLVVRIATGVRLRASGRKVNVKAANADLEACTRELRRRLREKAVAAAVEIATGLAEVVGKICEDGDADAEQLALISKLAIDAYRALDGDEAAGEIAFEVDSLLEKLDEGDRGPVALAAS